MAYLTADDWGVLVYCLGPGVLMFIAWVLILLLKPTWR